MPNSEDVYLEARRWVGTPYHHQGRTFQRSCDCIGLVIGVARALGLRCPADRDLPNYAESPHDGVAERTASELMAPARGEIQAGQVGLFWYRDRGHGQHFAIFAPFGHRLTMIHAYMRIGQVVEAGVSDFWRKRLIRAYTYRGITDA